MRGNELSMEEILEEYGIAIVLIMIGIAVVQGLRMVLLML